MVTAIRNLWPDDVTNVDIISPVAILRYQASQLRQRTSNLLEAEVESSISGTQITHRFAVIAPALNRHRTILFSVSHNEAEVYPATILADWFKQPSASFLSALQTKTLTVTGREHFEVAHSEWPVAEAQSDFIFHIGELLKSSHTKSLIQSLIVKSKEARPLESSEPVADASPAQ